MEYDYIRCLAYIYTFGKFVIVFGIIALLLYLHYRKKSRDAAELRARLANEREREQRIIGYRIRRELEFSADSTHEEVIRKATGLFSGADAQEPLTRK